MKRKFMIPVAIALIAAVAAVAFVLNAGNGGGEWRPGRPLAKEKVRVGVLYMDRAEGGYSQAHAEGVQRACARLGIASDQVIEKYDIVDADPVIVEHAMRECIAAGANVILATSWAYMATCEDLAGKFPGVVFAHASGVRKNDTNFTNYFGRIYLARYLAGIVAGMATRSGKIGYVAAKDRKNSEVTGGVNAFALGVESVNPGARVLVRVTNSWFDPSGERRAAARLLEAGCDIVAQHCDTPEPQLEAEKRGARGIGYNCDMRDFAPGAVMTSVIWNWDVYYERLLRSVMDGSFTTAPYFGGLNEGMVGLAPLTPGLTDAAMEEAVTAARKRMAAGFNVFDGELRTNDGRTVGRPGATLTDAEITAGIDWYYHTVAEL